MSSDDSRNLSEADPYVDNAILMTIENRDLDRLHVRSLTLGNASWWAKGDVSGPVDPRPFSLVLTVTKQWDERLGTFEATVPVEAAAGP